MKEFEFLDSEDYEYEYTDDASEKAASKELIRFFNKNEERVFYSRQVEVIFEDKYFHWITNRSLRQLVEKGLINTAKEKLSYGSDINLYWNKRYRYYKRETKKLKALVEAYADPNICAALGLQGEALVLEGFARRGFALKARETREFNNKKWTETENNIDFIFEKEGISYGVEVKNTLRYIEREEFDIKIRLCHWLELRPVFAVRMLPKAWIIDLNKEGGFGLILKYQLYPWGHKRLAVRVRKELGLPVDAPKALFDGTMDRFVNWHIKNK